MNTNNIKQIIFKELKSYFDHIGGYLLTALVLTITFFFFMQTFFLNNVVSMRDMFTFIPWTFSIFIPAITMGAFAAEKDKQTIEYLLTKPFSNIDLILGKILGATIFGYLPILLTLPTAHFVSKLGQMDRGETFAAYLGALILVLSLCTIGVTISLYFKNQILAFLTSAVVFFTLNIIGSDFTSINLPLSISQFLSKISILNNYMSLIRGAYDFKNLVYFFIIIVIGFSLSFINLQKIRISNIGSIFKNTLLTVSLTIILGGLVIYSSQLAKGRIDLTSSKKYTLSKTTKDLLTSEGKIKIDVYASLNLPNQFQQNYYELRNILDDYDFIGGNNVQVQYFNPKDHQDSINKLGIQPVRFNIVSEDQLKSQEGYLAVVISDEDVAVQEKIDFVDDINNLEYDITSIINKIKVKEKPQIAFASGNEEKSPFNEYSTFKEIMDSYYDVSTVQIPSISEDQKEDTNTDLNLSQYKALIIANPTAQYTPKAIDEIKNFYNNGGSIIYLAETMTINTQTLSAITSTSKRGILFEEYGITVNEDLIYDLKANIPVTLQAGNLSYMVNYPYFVRSIKNENTKLSNLPNEILLAWPSSLSISEDKKDKWEVLYETTEYGGSQTGTININPQQEFDTEKIQTYPLVTYTNNEKGGKLIVAGTAQIFSNENIMRFEENTLLGTKLLELSASTTDLSSIRAKSLTANKFIITNNLQKTMVRVFSPIISFGLLLALGIARMARRKVTISKYT